MDTATLSADKDDDKTKAASYTIDASHSHASFTVRHMMVTNVRGEFQKLSGAVYGDPGKPESIRIEAHIDVGSISTRDAQRDTHLRSADFFDVEKHPTITFRSKSVRRASATHLAVTGDLTIRGTTREVVLDVEGPTGEHKDPWGNLRIGASATTKIKRSDFGMTWNTALEAGGILVGDDVKIEIEVELTKAK